MSGAAAGDPRRWQGRIALFVIANLLVVPLIGRLGWQGMEALNTGGAIFGAVLLSVAVAGGILALNIWLVRRAVLTGLPRLGEMVAYGATGLQFVLTIGTGFFSVVGLIDALLR
ncbi:MAG: hypothetical protein AAFS07_09305 [Pseudomonadota bacterium]